MNIIKEAAKRGSPTAIRMQRVHDFRWGHQFGNEIVDFIIRDQRNPFLKSLLSQLVAKGNLSPKQIQVVLKMREGAFNG